MGKLLLLSVAAAAALPSAVCPRAQVFGGYSVEFSRVPASDLSTWHGWNASAACGLGSRLSLVGDFSGHYGRENEVVDVGLHRVLFGPRVTLHSARITPYVQFLIGVSRLHADSGGPAFTRNTMALAAGGGVDIRITRRWSVRAFDFHYIRQRFLNEQPHGGRVSAGLVFQFGE